MSERNTALTMPHSVRTLEIWIDRYGRLTRIESSGRLYELTGIRQLYRVVAHLFGEAALPESRTLHTATSLGLTREAMRQHRDRTLYYEVSNLVILLCYLPLAAMSWVLHSLLTVYAVVLCLLHLSLVLIERYKRALYGICLDLPTNAAEPQDHFVTPPAPRQDWPRSPATPSTSGLGRLAAWYFLPHRFETERLYRTLGSETVRGWVITFTRLTAVPQEHRHKTPRSISGSGIAGLLKFDHETRTSEASHMVGICLELPFLVLFILQRVPVGIAYIASLLFLNTSFVMLQRATRVRLWRVLSKRGVSRQ
jgi:hypothetical protein